MSTPIHVLLIEDNAGDARLVKEELRLAAPRAAIKLEWVDHLEQGLKWITANHIDAVLLDLSLPDSAGLETLQKVLSHAPHLPVIVMTGQAHEEVAIRAVQAGAQDYLIKGEVDGRLLARSIQYSIDRKQTIEALSESEERFRLIVESAPGAKSFLSTTWLSHKPSPSHTGAVSMVYTRMAMKSRLKLASLHIKARMGCTFWH